MKERLRAAWSGGDYSQLGRTLEPAAQELADACAVSAGQEVLDVAAGDGNFALAAAREGASVVASDLAPGMVERGRARSEAEGYEIEWVQADAEDLPFEDGRFDCAASVFGAFLAPRPEVAARELFRVVRAGGTVGMANWAADGPTAELFDLLNRYAPRPEGLPPPILWGDETVVRERFEGLAASIQIERRTLDFTAPSVEASWDLQSKTPGTSAMLEALPEDRFAAFREDLLAMTERQNVATDGSVRVPSDYLVVVARKRG